MAGRCTLTVGFALIALIHSAPSAQTIYRSTNANGQVMFSDIPPGTAIPPNPWSRTSPHLESSTLPNALRPVVAKFPVSLYAAKDCTPCDNARQMLRTRGIPFTEKTIDTPEDIEAFKQISGGNSLPMLSIGSQQFKGYSESAWQQYLGVAGYPEVNTLPPNYRYPLPSPLVIAKPAALAPESANPARETAPPVQAPRLTNPAGITF